MSVLLIAEHNNKEVRPFTYNAITAASEINEDLHVLVLGHQADDVAKSLSEVPNVKKVIHVDNEIYENYIAENYTAAIIKHAESYSHIVSSANTFGKNLMPRIAALSLSAISLINLKFSPFCIPLPPEITILAVPSSGLSDLTSSFFRNLVDELASAGSDFVISADPPLLSAGSNDVGLIVTHFFLSLLLTVAKAFPA